MKEQFVAKRFVNIILMLLVTILFSAALCVRQGVLLDEFICILVLDFLFFSLFFFVLEHNRLQKVLSQNRETDFQKILCGFTASCILVFCFSFLPEFAKPFLLVALIMCAVGTEGISVCISLYLLSIFGVVMECSNYELISYCMMILFGCMVAGAIENKAFRIWYAIIIAGLSTAVPTVFYYFLYQDSSYEVLFLGLGGGVVIDLFLFFIYPWMVKSREHEIDTRLQDIIDDEYPLVKELKKFSKKEYLHAQNVSRTAEKCGRLVGANGAVCKAAGFYYRIGILDGDQMVENGMMIAQKNCFPEAVITIIEEYYGQQKMPSTIESAIVQMVDGLTKKLEALEKTNKISGGWNKDMVIYQTLNEFSAQGLYDESGLSMNMFLKIREYLVKDEVKI